MTDARRLMELHLRQRVELGEIELVLDTHTRPELGAVLRGSPAAPHPAPDLRTAVAAAPTSASAAAMRAASDAPAAYAAADEILRLPTLEQVRDLALGCPRCRLAESRRQVVFGEGNASAELMVVGEAPGADEDRTGQPFVGRAGKLLTLLLASVGFERDAVYVCNVLKCRPPANRNPEVDEVEACSPYLFRQVELVVPRVILAFGAFAAQTLIGSSNPIGKLRGREHEFRGVPVVPTYHPAALLRNPGWVRPVWDDLQRVRSVLDRA